ncbi:MAG: NAD-dependent epimerase/dehydratase family protein [Chitinophagaceae bacterium]|nr:NAD-dependent epimerase/dehydratase family protein [Chitinophagaceae bacterium]
MKRKKVLITGASGFLGANLARHLCRLQYDVRVLVRLNANLSGITDVPCEIWYGNIDNRRDVMDAVIGCDIVIHSAAITSQWDTGFETYERINFTGTQYICEACMEHHISRLIYVSTANTIGPGSKDTPGTELNGFTLFHAGSGYINSKYLAQQYVLEQVQKKQLPAVIVNPTFMIGPEDRKPSSGQLLLYGLHKKVLFYPPGGKNFVYIEDVCNGIVNAIDQGRTGECYLLAGHNLSYGEFFRMVNKLADEPKLMIRIPAFVLKAGGLIGSLRKKITGKSGRLTYPNAYMLCLDNYYSPKKAQRELSMPITPMLVAVSHTLEWFRKNNYC